MAQWDRNNVQIEQYLNWQTDIISSSSKWLVHSSHSETHFQSSIQVVSYRYLNTADPNKGFSPKYDSVTANMKCQGLTHTPRGLQYM